jgi:uracil-DNA glycosylase family 4
MADTKIERLEILRVEAEQLTLSPLYPHRQESNHLLVFGEGSPEARLMLVGAAPGKQDAVQGRPLAGPSGKILDSLLESICLRRRDVYITNIVKDYSPRRTPTMQEVEVYTPFLERQIEIIQPRVLAALGRFAGDFLMQYFDLNQTERPAEVQAHYGPVHVYPLSHPAVALYNRYQMDTMLNDFHQIAALLT